MQFATLLPAIIACSHAMMLPHMESKGSLQKRADSDNASSGERYAVEPNNPTGNTSDHVAIQLHFIVVFKKGEADSAYKAHQEWIVKQISEVGSTGLSLDKGPAEVQFFNMLEFMGYISYIPPALLDTIKKDPLVDFVEEDRIVHAAKFARQKNAPWGIARISQRANKNTPDYDYDNQAGKGVTAYILDTGIKVEHPDFEGRATWGPSYAFPYVKVDADGHGTHVAGILGAKTYGVAKQVKLVAVQVLNATGEGANGNIILGVNYAVHKHSGDIHTKGYKGATINLSISGKRSNALDQAVNAAVDAGVHVVVSAGNDNDDACNFSAGRATGPITVGATDISDVRDKDSNFGKCVDVQAPGVNILSTGIHLPTDMMSGTSMACPHVAGIISTFVSLQPGVGSDFNVLPVTPKDLKKKFLGFSTRAVVKGLDKDTVNKLAYNGAGLSLHDLWIL